MLAVRRTLGQPSGGSILPGGGVGGIYWYNINNADPLAWGPEPTTGPSAGGLWKSDFDGSNPRLISFAVMPDFNNPHIIARSGDYVVFVNQPYIGRAKIDDSVVESQFITDPGAGDITLLVANSTYIWWFSDQWYRANADGTGIASDQSVIALLPGVPIVADEQYFYGTMTGAVWRSSFDAATIDTTYGQAPLGTSYGIGDLALTPGDAWVQFSNAQYLRISTTTVDSVEVHAVNAAFPPDSPTTGSKSWAFGGGLNSDGTDLYMSFQYWDAFNEIPQNQINAGIWKIDTVDLTALTNTSGQTYYTANAVPIVPAVGNPIQETRSASGNTFTTDSQSIADILVARPLV